MQLKNGKWLVAVSAGSDSMALLLLCMQENIDIVVAHVNYHHRNQSDEEENYVRNFCEAHKIPCYVKNEPFVWQGNFEAAARKYRYDFFAEIVRKQHLTGVLVAHHEDDLLETYLMQKEKNLTPHTYGLAKEMNYQGMLVVRPLLQYNKQDLEEICKNNQVRYYIDDTNFDTSYTRNHIRHTVIDQLSEEKRNHLLKTIAFENKQLESLRQEARSIIQEEKVSLNTYRTLLKKVRIQVLHTLLEPHYQKRHGLSLSYKEEIDEILLHKDDFMIPFGKQYQIVQEQGMFFVTQNPQPFAFQMKNRMTRLEENCPFYLSPVGEKKDGLTVKDEDFPLTFRNARKSDAIKMRFGTKKVHRFFIDRHIPLYKRKTWLVVENAKKEVIFVSQLGPDCNHYSIKPDFYVLQLVNIEKEQNQDDAGKGF